jgi:hypothetical protein
MSKLVAFYDRSTIGFNNQWLTPPAGGGLAGTQTALTIPGSNSVAGDRLLFWGDSWVQLPLGLIDLGDVFKDWGYDVGRINLPPLSSKRWFLLSDMAKADTGIGEFKAFLDQQLASNAGVHKIKAIVLSGGGNDSIGSKLAAIPGDAATLGKDLLNQKGSGTLIDENRLAAHLATMKGQYDAIVAGLKTKIPKNPAGEYEFPIIVHGYDHAYPNPNSYQEWIVEPFKRKGYTEVTKPNSDDLNKARMAMGLLIDRLNTVVFEKLAADNPGLVVYVNLRDSIRSHWPNGPLTGWDDSLHPSRTNATATEASGFEIMAAQIHDAIRKFHV